MTSNQAQYVTRLDGGFSFFFVGRGRYRELHRVRTRGYGVKLAISGREEGAGAKECRKREGWGKGTLSLDRIQELGNWARILPG